MRYLLRDFLVKICLEILQVQTIDWNEVSIDFIKIGVQVYFGLEEYFYVLPINQNLRVAVMRSKININIYSESALTILITF